LAKVALGSTTDRVLRTCASPVLMIPVNRSSAAMGTSPSQWKDTVVGVDFSEESLLAASIAARLLYRTQVAKTSLTLFHTVALKIEFRGPDVPVALPQHWDDAEAASRKQLEALAARFRNPKIDVRTATYRGYPSDGILHEARTRKSDVIALGTHGRGTVNRMLLGSVAERVLHHAECPVLTVRHPSLHDHGIRAQ
jgi:nucleotide-binding universal stress UspA family protein